VDAFADWLTPWLGSGSLLVVPLVILGGLITAFNPCCLPMYPAVFGFFGASCCGKAVASDSPHQDVTIQPLVLTTALPFVLGMATATALMGLLTAGLGWVFGQFTTELHLLMAIVPLFMGLHLLGILPLPVYAWHLHQPQIEVSRKWIGAVVSYGAGMLFSLAIAPCATPILMSILALVALQGDPLYGALLMFIYGLGAGLPLLLIGHGLTRVQHLFAAPGHQRRIRQLSGLLLLGVAAYIIWLA
jgi:cytochrome c biogenesis protein CcdA